MIPIHWFFYPTLGGRGLPSTQELREDLRSFSVRGSCGWRGARMSAAARWRGHAGSNAELSESGGWLEGSEEFQTDRALDDLGQRLLECNGPQSWLASLRHQFVERGMVRNWVQTAAVVWSGVPRANIWHPWALVSSPSHAHLIKVLRHTLWPGSAPAFVRATRVLTVRLRMLVPLGLLGGLFLAGGRVRSVQARSRTFWTVSVVGPTLPGPMRSWLAPGLPCALSSGCFVGLLSPNSSRPKLVSSRHRPRSAWLCPCRSEAARARACFSPVRVLLWCC